MIKRRGKLGLVGVNKTLEEVKTWLSDHMGREMTVGEAVGRLSTFIVEPFLPHRQSEEFYACIYATRPGNRVLFTHEGGMEVGDVDSKAVYCNVDINDLLTMEQALQLVAGAPQDKQR